MGQVILQSMSSSIRRTPASRINEDTIIHFGPPAAILLESETTTDFHFVGLPRHDPAHAHWHYDNVPEKAAVAAARRQAEGFAVQRSVRLHRLQGAGQDAGPGSTRAARDAHHGDLRPECSVAMRPLQLVRAAVKMPIAGWDHAAVRGAQRDFVGNVVPSEMMEAEERLGRLSDATVSEAELVGLERTASERN